MSRRKVSIVLLCEDLQQEVFVRRFLVKQGFERHKIRSNICPKGTQSAVQFVLNEFPKELNVYRKRSNYASIKLIALVDADTGQVIERIQDLTNACNSQGIPFRNNNEKVAFFIPKRNIETWLRYLRRESFDENTAYPKYSRQRDCMDQVNKLFEMCNSGGLNAPAPNSLELACVEFNERIKEPI